MARLNEVPAPIESVDALKRRFVRQNRELARINSNQSVRIRNLESEISRLLSENIAFRERVISLEHEVDRSPGQAAVDDVGSIRSRLEAKLGQLGCLVQELGKAHGNLSMGRLSRRQSTQQSSPRKSPDRITLGDISRNPQIPRLPPIIEDNLFPKRTLESEELPDIVDSAKDMDSPELGPPPTATLDEGDPIKYDSLEKPTGDKGALIDGGNVRDSCNSNLETRRKRRESSHRIDSGPSDPSDEFHYERVRAGNTSIIKSQQLKVGAKRKLNVREDGEGNGKAKASEQEALILHRRRGNSIVVENEAELEECSSRDPRILRLPEAQITTNHNASSRQERTKHTTSSSVSKARKALGPKSVNTDPVQSPAKLKASLTSDKSRDRQNQPVKKPLDQGSSIEANYTPIKGIASGEERISTVQEVAKQPGTPAAPIPLSVSPQSSIQSPARPRLLDTPPPPDLSVDAASIIGRATRRPRGSVSYAEPNLRDKMRRPTKDFVDAVGSDDRLQLVKVEEVKRMGADAEKGRIKTVIVKREDPGEDTDTAWKNLPLPCDGERPSSVVSIEPLNPSKTEPSTNSQLPASVATDRGHSDHGALRKEVSQSSSVSGSTIAALVAGSHKARKRERDSLDETMEEPKELFELHTSSPGDDMASQDSSVPARRPSRRHSSVAKRPNPKSLGVTAADSVGKRGDQRRESMLSSTIKGEGQADKTMEAKGVKSMGRLQKSALEMNSSRAERSASRRRSMML